MAATSVEGQGPPWAVEQVMMMMMFALAELLRSAAALSKFVLHVHNSKVAL
jgi:hypothetical protein